MVYMEWSNVNLLLRRDAKIVIDVQNERKKETIDML